MAARSSARGSRSLRTTGGGGGTCPVRPWTAVQAERTEYSTVNTQSRGISQNWPMMAKFSGSTRDHRRPVACLARHELAGDERHPAGDYLRAVEEFGPLVRRQPELMGEFLEDLPAGRLRHRLAITSPGRSPRRP